MSRELNVLRKLLEDPPRPAIYVLGGAKVEDKVPVIENILSTNKADKVFVGGVVSKFFLRAMGRKLAKADEKAIAEQPRVLQSAKRIIRKFRRKVLVPTDYAVNSNGARHSIPVGYLARSSGTLDIGDSTIGNLVETVRSSMTVVASGPLGVFEQNGFDVGTRRLLLAMAHVTGFTVIGGGHLAGFAGILGISEKFSHVSTAGGAMLSLLAGEELPAVRALVDAAKRHEQRSA
jgi:phosphoglycerate kinase